MSKTMVNLRLTMRVRLLLAGMAILLLSANLCPAQQNIWGAFDMGGFVGVPVPCSVSASDISWTVGQTYNVVISVNNLNPCLRLLLRLCSIGFAWRGVDHFAMAGLLLGPIFFWARDA